MRIGKLLRELNIDLQSLSIILRALNFKEEINLNTSISDDIVCQVRYLCNYETDLFSGINDYIDRKSKSPLKIVGCIDLDENNNPVNSTNNIIMIEDDNEKTIGLQDTSSEQPPYENSNPCFWIEEIIYLSNTREAIRINIGSFSEYEGFPLYSVLIGYNGIGKSSLLKDLIDFFIDLHYYAGDTLQKNYISKVKNIRGIKYHIDGCTCEVVKTDKSYLAKINGVFKELKYLRLPAIVACHFGAFDKFPFQKVNGYAQTRYDVPHYKYVGAHVSGSMVSSTAIAFRLLFSLTENMDERQLENMRSILDFIGYDHKISLRYSLVQKSRKEGITRNSIAQQVLKDKEYENLSNEDKNLTINRLYNLYMYKSSSLTNQHYFNIDIDHFFDPNYKNSLTDLGYIYRLKQYGLLSSSNVIFFKNGQEITSEDMSSGEFAMLSTVLSISAAANDPHTLVLLDEPELSQHPNWQMMIIDNLDRALSNKVCHTLIATHSHMIVSDLPMNRSCVTQLEKNSEGKLIASSINECTYGWSAEEVLFKVFKTATDRNRYFGERIANLLEQMGNNSISKTAAANELRELKEISRHLSDIDPMKVLLNSIVNAFN